MIEREGANHVLYTLIVGMTGVVFVGDLLTPLGVAVWLLYLAPLLLALYTSRSIVPVIVAAAASILISVGYFLAPASPSFDLHLIAGINAGLGVVTIGAAAVVGRQFMVSRLTADRLDWLRSGQNKLAARLQGEQSVEGLARKVIAFLAEYLDAQIGAVYVEEDRGSFVRVANFAGNGDVGDTVTLGQGLVGQAAADQRMVVVHDIPEDYVSVRSATGAARPRSIVLAPMRALGEVSGIIELGFFATPSVAVTEMLDAISDPIGVAFRSTKYKARQEELLEKSQQLSEELQVQQEELRQQNEELEQQSRAMERQRDDLVRAQTELQRITDYKSEFLANMSHELRTPLNSTLILAKLLGDNREGNLSPEQVKFAQTIQSAGNDLLTLINDILDLSQIEAGKLDARPESVSLTRLVDDLANTFNPVAKDKALAFTTEVEDGLPETIHTDPARLQQILKNLVANALKFTEQGGVSLHVRRAATDRIAFAVKDTGIGVASEQHKVIFEAFHQADGTTNRRYGGTGLGLSISKDLALLLGGEITLESTPGLGTTFTLLLPEHFTSSGTRPEASAIARSATYAPGHYPEEALTSVAPLNLPTSDREASAPGSGSGSGERSLLIIEDDPEFAGVLQALAHELDFQTLLARTAEEGLAMAQRHRPKAIVLDIGLPDRSGLLVLDSLKHNSLTRHIPVHVLSGSDYAQEAMQMGAVGCALKPVKHEQLVSALRLLESKFQAKKRYVLVVEGDVAHRDETCSLLASDDVETVAVGTAAEALERLATSTFDCMVLELALPDQSGFELLEQMANKEQYSFPPVIVYTSRSLSQAEEQELRRFARAIIIKGARSPERLVDEVTLFLHQVESELPPDRQRMLRDVRERDAVFEGRRVLVVEDDVRNIFALTSLLEPKGAKVEIARNGREALRHLQENPGVDLVLMDVMMPVMDGLQATREIRSQLEHAKLPIIALTAKAMAEDREDCLAAGANDYIAKPIDLDRLLSLARVWMPK